MKLTIPLNLKYTSLVCSIPNPSKPDVSFTIWRARSSVEYLSLSGHWWRWYPSSIRYPAPYAWLARPRRLTGLSWLRSILSKLCNSAEACMILALTLILICHPSHNPYPCLTNRLRFQPTWPLPNPRLPLLLTPIIVTLTRTPHPPLRQASLRRDVDRLCEGCLPHRP